jgi:7-keto-8-aminopelargonate synthetase-like enzyme
MSGRMLSSYFQRLAGRRRVFSECVHTRWGYYPISSSSGVLSSRPVTADQSTHYQGRSCQKRGQVAVLDPRRGKLIGILCPGQVLERADRGDGIAARIHQVVGRESWRLADDGYEAIDGALDHFVSGIGGDVVVSDGCVHVVFSSMPMC